jgi:hypothetical protein
MPLPLSLPTPETERSILLAICADRGVNQKKVKKYSKFHPKK